LRIFLFAGCKVLKRFLLLETINAFWTGLEVEPQGAFDGDLAIAKIGRIRNLGIFAIYEREKDVPDTCNMFF
jgi:hypothetical protein